MTQFKEIIHNLETGEITERPFTPEEIAQIEAEQAKAAEIQAALAQQAAEKAAVLAKLGLTAEEAAALLS